MKGKIKLIIKNRHITFDLLLERNVTVLTGDSGTGKTKLIDMVRNYSEYGKASGVSLKCDKACAVLSGNDWERTLDEMNNTVVFVEESTAFIRSYDFARAIQNTDNYYVLVTREPLPQISYSIDEIKKIIKNQRKPKIEKIYNNISNYDISQFAYDVIIVEDSKAGYEFFCKATEAFDVDCISSKGKSGILPLISRYSGKRILVVADAAALGSEIRELVRYKEISDNKVDFFLPESFEWLILKSNIFLSNAKVKNILDNPVEYIESRDYFSWERYFLELLTNETKDNQNLKYNKRKLTSGYLSKTNMEGIINAMKGKNKT